MIAVVSALRGEVEQSMRAKTQILYSKCGVGVERAMEHTQKLLKSKPITKIYFIGSAGALSPKILNGTVIIPRRVIYADPPASQAALSDGGARNPIGISSTTSNSQQCSAVGGARNPVDIPDTISKSKIAEIKKHVASITQHPLLTVNNAVATLRKRIALYHRHAAVAVDMEAWGVAWAASQNRVPISIVKYITDTKAQDLHEFRAKLTPCAAKLRTVMSILLEMQC